MKNKQAFTLIELLVVVLIIGILAAVALPQYQKAVDKARLVQLIVFNKAIREAEERYYLANGSYTNDFNVLDVGFAATEESGHYWVVADGTSFYLASNGTNQSVSATSPLLPGVSLRSVYAHAGQGIFRDGRMLCYADKNNARANRACQSIGTDCQSVDDTRNICFVSKQ